MKHARRRSDGPTVSKSSVQLQRRATVVFGYTAKPAGEHKHNG